MYLLTDTVSVEPKSISIDSPTRFVLLVLLLYLPSVGFLFAVIAVCS